MLVERKRDYGALRVPDLHLTPRNDEFRPNVPKRYTLFSARSSDRSRAGNLTNIFVSGPDFRAARNRSRPLKQESCKPAMHCPPGPYALDDFLADIAPFVEI